MLFLCFKNLTHPLILWMVQMIFGILLRELLLFMDLLLPTSIPNGSDISNYLKNKTLLNRTSDVKSFLIMFVTDLVILWSLYVLLFHSIGSFGCIDCCMNNNQRRQITVTITILLIILLDWLEDQGKRVVIRRLLFDSHVNDNKGGCWIIFDNQEMRWVVRKLPFNLCINDNQGGASIIIIIILSLFILLLE